MKLFRIYLMFLIYFLSKANLHFEANSPGHKTIKPKFCRQIFVVKDKYWSCTCESWRYSTPFLFAKGGSTKSIYEFDFNIFTLKNHILPGLPYWYDSSFVNAAEKTTFGKYLNDDDESCNGMCRVERHTQLSLVPLTIITPTLFSCEDQRRRRGGFTMHIASSKQFF